MKNEIVWRFPLSRTHTGVLLGNGATGAIVWGEGRFLRITLGRSDFWDHRGGMAWKDGMSYRAIRGCLEAGDETGLRALFEQSDARPGEPRRPTVLPVGRVDLDLGPGARLVSAALDLASGLLTVAVRKGRTTAALAIVADMAANRFSVRLPAALASARAVCVPAWRHVGAELAAVSYVPPEEFGGDGTDGWVQSCPADPALAVVAKRAGREICVAIERGADAAAARTAAVRTASVGLRAGFASARAAVRCWWAGYRRTIPAVAVPNERLDLLYRYGMYKLAVFTNPAGPPATLQGPWVEEYRLPPWSNDYHFNINVQMCYQPVYHGNRLENLMPLFDMIRSWEPVLRRNARIFLGIDDGVMLPHAVDDRCTCMGGFWTGSIDHGCTAWVALMMHRYWRYTMDRRFLRERAFPFMKAALRVYEGMLDREGGRLQLPVSVSPEYRGAAMNAWGRNASFQLACCHALAEACVEAAGALGESPAAAWGEILRDLPKAALCGEDGREEIGLWEGLVLEESHRHHSHLAGIAPFDTLDLDDPRWRGIVERSLARWILRGPGMWSGWCIPWASAIHSRVGNAGAAELFLEIFEQVYTNEGHGTLHDCAMSGFSLMGAPPLQLREPRPDIMQMDGGMGAVAAIQEMLIHTRRGVCRLFAGAPARWRDVSFSRMRTDGAFLVSARRTDGVVGPVKVESPAGGAFLLANPWGGPAVVLRGKSRIRVEGAVLRIPARRNETFVVRKA